MTNSVERRRNLVAGVAVTTAIYMGVGFLILCFVALFRSGDSATSEWEQTQKVNAFWEGVAGEPTERRTVEGELAADLRRVMEGGEDPRKALAAFEAPLDSRDRSVYLGAGDSLGQPIFEKHNDRGNLTPAFEERALAAFKGDLNGLVVEAGERPEKEDNSFLPPKEVLAALILFLSTATFLGVSYTQESDERRESARSQPLSWKLDGEETREKVLMGVMVPGLGGVMVLGWLQRSLKGAVESYRKYRIELAETESRRVSKDDLPSIMQGPYLTAQKNVERLEVLSVEHPGDAEIEKALVRAKEVLSALSITRVDLSADEAKAEARALARESETLLESRTASIYGAAVARQK